MRLAEAFPKRLDASGDIRPIRVSLPQAASTLRKPFLACAGLALGMVTVSISSLPYPTLQQVSRGRLKKSGINSFCKGLYALSNRQSSQASMTVPANTVRSSSQDRVVYWSPCCSAPINVNLDARRHCPSRWLLLGNTPLLAGQGAKRVKTLPCAGCCQFPVCRRKSPSAGYWSFPG